MFRMNIKALRIFIAISAMLSLTACGSLSMQQDSAPTRKVNFSTIPNAVPKVLPESRYGNPKSYTVAGVTYHVRKSAVGFEERGIASWYGTKFHGKLTSTRQPYNMFGMTAAMRTIPIPAYAEVTNLQNGRHVIVEVNDRGPFADNRIIDLSYAAAGKLDMLRKGTALVEVKIINPRTWNKHEEHKIMHEQPKLSHPGQPELYIQVGAFGDKANAEREVKKLHNMVLQDSRIQNINEQGRKLYRVQIGPLKSVEISDIVSKRLRKLGYQHPLALIE